MAEATQADVAGREFWNQIIEFQNELNTLQWEMVNNAKYLQAGSRSRIDKYVNRIQKRLAQLEREMKSFDEEQPIQWYFAGVQEVAPKGFKMTAEDRLLLNEISRFSQDSHHRMISYTRRDVRRFGNAVRNRKRPFFKDVFVPKYMEQLKRYVNVRSASESKDFREQFIRKNRIKGVKYVDGRTIDFYKHEDMNIRTVRQRALNLGRIRGQELKNRDGYLLVHDGPGCGWTSHHDGEVANGKIVSYEEARAYPIAHPNCTRTFSPTNKKPPDKGKALKKAVKIAVGVAAAAEASNLAVKGIQAAAASQTFERMREEVMKKALATQDPQAFALEHRMAQFQRTWTPEDAHGVAAGVVPMFGKDLKISAEALQPAISATGTEGAQAVSQSLQSFRNSVSGVRGNVTPGQAEQFLRSGMNATRAAANSAAWLPRKIVQIEEDAQLLGEAWVRGYLEYHQIPSKIRAALQMTPNNLKERFSILNRMLRNRTMREMPLNELLRATGLEDRFRKAQQLTLFEGTPAQSAARLSFSRWGPRMRMDITDWLRAKGTMTPTGLIKSLTVAPKQALRANIKMFQDGTIGGHLSLVPKGIFRAIVEVDDAGRITGNVRAILPGPFKLRLEFETPRPKDWERLGLIPGKDFVDWRSRIPSTRVQPGMTLVERLKMVDMSNAIQDLRKLELKRVVFDVRLLNTDLVDLAVDLRVPLKDVRAAVSEGAKLGRLLQEAGGGWTGRVLIPIERGADELINLWRSGEAKSTVFADVSFAKGILPTKVENRVHLNSGLMQDWVANFRFRGYNFFNIADVMGLDVDQVKTMAGEAIGNSRMFLNELGARTLLDVEPQWQRRLWILQQAVPFRDQLMNRADLVTNTLNVFTQDRPTAAHSFAIRTMAGITKQMGPAAIELRLRSLVAFLGQSEVDSAEILDKLALITKGKMRQLSMILYRENQRGLA